jgi:lipid-binding SYLF domain-containing protein
MLKRFRSVFAITLSAVLLSTFCSLEAGSKKAEKERARMAAEVLNEIMKSPDQSIPRDLLNRSYAIAVIPHVVKGAFGLGGRFGKGLIAARNTDGTWGPAAFVDLGGGSIGFQIGVTATDLILVFTDAAGLKGLLSGKLKIGADAAAAAGPVGRTAELGTDIQLKSAIYSYSRSKGLFAGVSLDGAVLSIDDSANHEVYGLGITGTDILIANKVKTNAVVQPFHASLSKHAPHRKK